MRKELLKLTPEKFLCPYCGKWHDWEDDEALEDCDVEFNCATAEKMDVDNIGCYRIYFDDNYCYYSTESMCYKAELSIERKIPISSIVESTDEPIVTFLVPFETDEEVGKDECSDCDFRRGCLCPKLGDKSDNCHMIIKFGFKFKQSDYDKIVKNTTKTTKSNEPVSAKQQVRENKEATTMNNNIFSMNLEWGPNTDENIASTIMGVAVNTGDSWRIYDKEKKEITDIGDMQLGNFPIFIVPTTKLSEGDLIKDAGEYYFVTKLATTNNLTQTLSVKTGEVKSVVPIKNVLGIRCYSKVIALSDSLGTGEELDIEKLIMMLAMYGQPGENGGQRNQLLPLLLFKDKLGGDDDAKNLILMSSMFNQNEESGQTNQFLPLLLFKDKLGGDDDTMKLFMLSAMSGGSMGENNNPVMNYLMLKTLMSEKKKEVPEQIGGKPEA